MCTYSTWMKYAYKTTNGRKPVEIHNLSLKPNNFVGTSTTYV